MILGRECLSMVCGLTASDKPPKVKGSVGCGNCFRSMAIKSSSGSWA